MGFRYLDRIATREHLEEFLNLADLAAGAGDSASNVFLLSDRLRQSAPMRLCQKILAEDPAAQALIQQRRLSGPYDPEALRRLPRLLSPMPLRASGPERAAAMGPRLQGKC